MAHRITTVECRPPARDDRDDAPATPAHRLATVSSLNGPTHTERRGRMLADDIERRGVRDALVLAAMRAVPRHRFVPAEFTAMAHDDRALPIGRGQTISQPYIVAVMAEAARVEPGDVVLDVGTGSGYGAAVLREIGAGWLPSRMALRSI